MRRQLSGLLALLSLLLAAGCREALGPAPRTTGSAMAAPSARIASGFELLGMAVLPTGFEVDGTEVGGLSAITYDRRRDCFYALSDDRSERSPARFYTLRLELDTAAGHLSPAGFDLVAQTPLQDLAGQPFATGSIDPEGIALSATGSLFVSSEGDTPKWIDPFVRELALDGTPLRALPVPADYLPRQAGDRGIRRNLGFEPLTVTPDGTLLITGTENALLQDGEPATLEAGSPSRLLVFEITTGRPLAEYIYRTDPVARPPAEAGAFHTNGLVELLALDNRTLLALERSYSAGAGNSIRLFRLSLDGADRLDTSNAGTDIASLRAVSKTLLLDLSELGLVLDNIEGMTFGPDLDDGRRSLILVSDNNFSAEQMTQLIALGVEPTYLLSHPARASKTQP